MIDRETSEVVGAVLGGLFILGIFVLLVGGFIQTWRSDRRWQHARRRHDEEKRAAERFLRGE